MTRKNTLFMLSVFFSAILYSCHQHVDVVSEDNVSDSISFAKVQSHRDSLNKLTEENTTLGLSSERVITKEEYNSSEKWYSEFWTDPEEFYRFYNQVVVKSKMKGISLDSVLRDFSHSELPYDSVVKWYTNDSPVLQ